MKPIEIELADGTKKKIMSWCPELEPGAYEQARNLAMLPFIHKHVALMPDCHQGYGMPIGGVIGTRDVVIPNAVGVDIGCGMRACKMAMGDFPMETLKKILGCIREAIPVGFGHRKPVDDGAMPAIGLDEWEGLPVIKEEFLSAKTQLGTLGGGNHFIEIQKGSDGFIWFMIHSGSRNIGLKVAKHYNDIAKHLNKDYHSSIPEKYDLAFLPTDSREGELYLNEMNYCLKFAEANRRMMSTIIQSIFMQEVGVRPLDEFDVHHNYAKLENHMGENVWIHRKGATRAYEGETGIIPGSQGTASYIVEGKGNILSFKSCSHGSGRAMSRTKAQASLDLATEQKRLDDQGILHAIRGKEDLDEASGAYKDIESVMANQADLVSIKVKLQPLAVVKG